MTSKPIIKFGLTSRGRFILLSCPRRVAARIFYNSMAEIIDDLPLALFDYKIVDILDYNSRPDVDYCPF